MGFIKKLNKAHRSIEMIMSREEKNYIRSFGRDTSRKSQDRYGARLARSNAMRDGDASDSSTEDIRFIRLAKLGQLQYIEIRNRNSVMTLLDEFDDIVFDLIPHISSGHLGNFMPYGKIRKAFSQLAIAGVQDAGSTYWCNFIQSGNSNRLKEVWMGTSATPSARPADRRPMVFRNQMIVSFIQASSSSGYQTIMG